MKKITYVRNGKETNILPEGAENYFKGDVKTPKFRSWNGYNGWAETLVDQLGITFPRARLMLILNGRVCLSTLDNMSDEDVKGIERQVTPFRIEADLIPNWVESGLWRTRSFSMHVKMHPWDSTVPGITWNLVHFFEKERIWHSVVERYIRGKTSWIRSVPDFLKLVFGRLDIQPFLDKGYSLSELINIQEKYPGILHKLDLEYLPHGTKMHIDNLLKAGAKPRELFPDFTKAEANKVALAALEKGGVSSHYFSVILGILFEEQPQWVYNYSKTILVAKWAIAHKEQLSQVKEYTTHVGERVVIHVHRILDHVRDEHLPRGVNTGFHYVVDLIKDLFDQEIKEQLKEDFPLPEFPLDIEGEDERIMQLLSSHELRDEGEHMKHCVGSYIKMVKNQTCWIFHVDLDDSKGATVEVRRRGADSYFVNQSMLEGNEHSAEAANIVTNALEKAKKKK